MLRTTIGQLMINEALPPALRNYNRTLDAKGMQELGDQLAMHYPEQYKDVMKKLTDIGRDVAFSSGGMTFGLKDLLPTPTAMKVRTKLLKGMDQIINGPGNEEEKNQKLIDLANGMKDELEKGVFDDSLRENNPLALQILSGARGNPGNLRSLRGSDLLYADHRNRDVPVPIVRSYSEGLSPVELYAATFGARKGLAATKLCLREGTEVLMGDFTTKRIEDIVVDDIVWTLDDAGKMIRTRVVRTYDNGRRKCWRWYFRNGRAQTDFLSVDSTAEHELLLQYRNKDGDTIQAKAAVKKAEMRRSSAVLPAGVSDADGIDEPRAGLVGLLLGDGGLTTHNTLFYNADSAVVDAVATEARPFNLTPQLTREAVGTSVYVLTEIEKSEGIGGGHKTPFRAWLQELGMLGKLAPDKRIPQAVWTWNRSSVGRLAAFLLETDGWFTWMRSTGPGEQAYPIVGFGSSSRQLAEGFRRLLAIKLGIFSSKLEYRPCAGDTSVFYRDGEAREYVRNHDMWCFSIRLRPFVRRIAEHWRDTGSKACAFQAAFATTSAVYRDDLPARFASRTYLGMLPTRDIEVEHPSHLFVLANGLVVANSTADAGFFEKQLVQATHRLVVDGLDSEDDDQTGMSEWRGLPVQTDDNENVGALLARAAGRYPRNTVLTPKILRELKAGGLERILVRSPIVGGPASGGVYARDVGARERGGLAPTGDFVGPAAAQAIAERLMQGSLGSKHGSGSSKAGRSLTGFQLLNQTIQVPKSFKGGAAHSQMDGKVQAIEDAPQGGKYIFVEGTKHYVADGFDPIVKVGDTVEAGDVLSDGTPNPSEIVRHKGLGEGKRYFVQAFHKAYKDSGLYGHRRNIELVARGLINHVKLTNEMGDYSPDDVVPYHALEHSWQRREGWKRMAPSAAVGKYLEQPVLHHSIGTKIRPSMLKDFQDFNVKEIEVHDEPAPFEPVMVRAMENLHHDPEWMPRMLGSNLQSSTLRAVHRGGTTDAAGTSFVPALAQGVGYGKYGKTKSWKPSDVKPIPDLLDGL